MTIEDIRKIALNKKNELIQKGESTEKIDNVIIVLSDDMFFFKTDINISVPILLYIGISEDNVKRVYFELIDYKNFHNNLGERNAFDFKL